MSLLFALENAVCGKVCLGHVVEFYPDFFFVYAEDLCECVCEGFGDFFALFLCSSLDHVDLDDGHFSTILLFLCLVA
mgnify:CR=1 FL=1